VSDIIDAHVESVSGNEDSYFGESRDQVKKSYRKERFIDENQLFDDYED